MAQERGASHGAYGNRGDGRHAGPASGRSGYGSFRSGSRDGGARSGSRGGFSGGDRRGSFRRGGEDRGFSGGERRGWRGDGDRDGQRRSWRGRDGGQGFGSRDGERRDGDRRGSGRGWRGGSEEDRRGSFRSGSRDGGARSGSRGGFSGGDRRGSFRRGDGDRGFSGGERRGWRGRDGGQGFGSRDGGSRDGERRDVRDSARRNSDGTLSFPSQNPYTHRREGEPRMPKGIEWAMLSAEERERLRGLSKEHAENIGLHILAAYSLEEQDPAAALEHATWAARQASRIDFAREVLGLIAYRQGEYKLALRELRTAYRMNGYLDYLPFIADCERGLGNPKKVMDIASSDDAMQLRGEAKAEMFLVYAGALADLQVWDKAIDLVHTVARSKGLAGAYRMRAIQAEQYFLEEAGRGEEAAELDQALDRLELQYADADEDETAEDAVIDYDLAHLTEDLMEEVGISEDDAQYAPEDFGMEDGDGESRTDCADDSADDSMGESAEHSPEESPEESLEDISGSVPAQPCGEELEGGESDGSSAAQAAPQSESEAPAVDGSSHDGEDGDSDPIADEAVAADGAKTTHEDIPADAMASDAVSRNESGQQ